MKIFLFFIIIILASNPFNSFAGKKQYGNVEVLSIISVYDGDTFRANLKFYSPIIGQNMGIRLSGIDTPEIRDKRKNIKALAIKAREFEKRRLRNGIKITLKKIRRGKYFRIVAEVWIDGVELGSELIKARLAKPYYGGKKQKWKMSRE